MSVQYQSVQQFLGELAENCLLLARHGQTDWNAMNLIQGQQDRPLSPEGFRQRKNLFFALQEVRLARIFTSTLERTIETARPLSKEKGVPIETVPEFDEAGLGVFEGEHKVNFSDEFSRQMYNDFLKDEINVVLPGGAENLRMLNQRILSALEKIMHAVTDSGHTLLVGHRNVNKMIVKNLLGLTIEKGYRVEHENNWLYIYAPQLKEIFHTTITAPHLPIEVAPGYRECIPPVL